MTADHVLDIARAELGTTEAPAGSNRVKYNTWYYGQAVSGAAYPWCMAFVQWCLNQAGVDVILRTASCGALMRAAKAAGQWVTGDYKPGDVVIYDFPGGAATDHTGIIERADATKVVAIEGNTSQSGSQSNGGQVCRKTRPLAQVVGAWRPNYKEDEDMTQEQFNELMRGFLSVADTGDQPADWGRTATEYCQRKGIFNGDGAGNFGWQQPITREAAAQVIYNILEAAGLLERLPDKG